MVINKGAQSQQRTIDDASTAGYSLKDLSPTVDSKNLMSIKLKKGFYGARDALLSLDEEFKFFKPQSYSVEYFFNSYNMDFYSIPRSLHMDFIKKSINYAYPEGYFHPLIIEKEEIEKDIKNIQREIDSIEKSHFYYKNRSFIMEDIHSSDPESIISTGRNIYYIQSGKKREVKDFQTYLNLKTQLTKGRGTVEDIDLINFLSKTTLDQIPNGPDILNLDDTFIDPLIINIYPQTLEEYETEGGEPPEIIEKVSNNKTPNIRP